MKTSQIVNTFLGGMNKDLEPAMVPNDSYIEAWNAVMQGDEHFNLTNEHSTKLEEQYGGKIVGYIRVPARDATLYFVRSASSSVHLFNHTTGKSQKVVEDSEYGCSWNFDQCEFILGEYKKLSPCNDLLVYFSSNCTFYRLNIDELLDSARRQHLTCKDFFLFNCICGPKQQPFVLEGAGKDLLAGAYQFSVQLQDGDGNTTNWFLVGEPVYLGSENNNPNEASDDGVAVQLKDLNPNYTRANVAVVRTNGGATDAFLITSRTYNSSGVTIEYTSQDQHIEDIPLEEILIKEKKYLKGKRLFQKDGRLFLYQLQQENNLDYQRQANQIQTKYQVFKVPADEAWRFKQLLRDEVYAFGIVWEYCDGTTSPVFHIPNNVAKPGGNAESCSDCDVPEWLVNSSAQRTATFCEQTINNDVEDICYCPPNAECDENCNVIIGVIPGGPNEEVCRDFQFSITQADPQPPGSNSCFLIEIEVDVFVDGVLQTIPLSFFFSSNTANASTGPITGNSVVLQGWRDVTTSGDCVYELTYEAINCAPQQIPGTPSSKDDQTCPPGQVCFSGSDTCSGGSCGGTCGTGGGCGADGSASLSSGRDVRYDSDIRPTVVHQNSYQRENCSDASQFITDEGDILSCSDCAGGGVTNDAPILFKGLTNCVEYLRDLLRIDDDVLSSPTLNTSSSVGDAVGKLCSTLNNVERQGVKAAELEKDTTPAPILGLGGTPVAKCEGFPIYADDGCTIIGYQPALIAEGTMGYWESCELYPLDRNCDGEFIYGELAGQPIRHHKMPDVDTEPLFESTQQGVENFMEPDNLPDNDTNVFILGAAFENIQQPVNPPKPICGYQIVMAKREGNDKSIIGKGLMTHTFGGESYGKTYAINKHGVNSWSYVDRHIENGEEENRKGYSWDKNIFAFHSLDVNTFEPFLNADYVKIEAQLFGTGWKYGNYAEGPESSDPGFRREDRRGVRQAVTLNRRLLGNNQNLCISGITYAPENSIVNKAPGIDHPIMNKYREKAVYFQTEEAPSPLVHRTMVGVDSPDPYIDYSFIGDGVDHPQPINIALAHMGSLKRYNKCQYGNIENLTYVGTGLSSNNSSVSGTFGDTHVGLYSFKKSGYVSNKVGDVLNDQFADIAGGRIRRRDFLGVSPRTVCMPPNRAGVNLEEDLGMWDSTELPTTGDTKDPKNMASLHPTRRWNEVFDLRITEVESDVFYPRTLTTLIHFWQESEINPKFRGTGSEQLREIFYPLLKGSEVDSEVPNPGGAANTGWLNDFHQRQRRISRRQLALKAAIRTFVKVGLPGLFAAMVAGTETGLELTSTLAVSPILVAGWLVLDRYVLSPRNLNKLLGIEECLTDEQGAQAKEDIQGFKDNWHRYSLDYSHLNDINTFIGLPQHYNTCDCSDCSVETNNEVYYSNPQAIDSPVDAYRNFQSNNFLNIPAKAGQLQNLFVVGNRFYAHTTDGIWVLQYSNTALPSDNGMIILGQGDLLEKPQGIMEAVLEGHAGIQHPKTAVTTRFGYVFQDEEARKIYVFSEEGLRELNGVNSGMYNWFRKHLPQCTETCSEIPFAFGADYENNRMLFSNNGWTISYHFPSQKWIAFHSYRPDFYVFDRYNIYGIENEKIWKHNQEDYQNFYGEDGEFSVEFPVNQAASRSMFPLVIENSIVDGETNLLGDAPVRNLPVTFDKMVAWNTHQTTGMMDIDVQDPNSPTDLSKDIKTLPGVITWFRRGMGWRYNNVKDATIDPKKPIWTLDRCTNKKELNTSNIDMQKPWDVNHKVEDRFIIYKYIASKATKLQMVLRSVFTRIKNTEEHSHQ